MRKKNRRDREDALGTEKLGFAGKREKPQGGEKMCVICFWDKKKGTS